MKTATERNNRIKMYLEWRKSIQGCTDCQLCETRTNVVVDSGNLGSRWALIGEAPGSTEDRKGEAFVGPSGQMLRSLIANAEMGQMPTFFNIVRCRPPGNVFPDTSVARKCQAHTNKQLTLLRPEIVVLTGRQAARWVLFSGRETRMKDILGNYYWSAEFPFVKYFTCCYHPAYLMRQSTTKKQLLSKNIVEMFHQIQKDLEREEVPMRGKPVGNSKQNITSLF